MNKVITHRLLFYLFSSIPAIYYLWHVFAYSENIPAWDDYHSVFVFINDFITSSDFRSRFDLIISQHNEHRIIVNRIVNPIVFITSLSE